MSNYTYMYDKFIRLSFGKKKIAKIVFSDILLFYKGLLSKMSVNTVEVINTILRPTFQFALRDNLIRNDHVDGALSELKKKSKFVTEDRKALSQSDQKTFFSLLEGPRNKNWENLFIVLFGTGCRVGEFTALTWNDVDFENRIITIDHNLTFIPPFSCHIARHTFCTRLYENGVDIKTIQSVMGHKDIGTTLDIYAEISESKKKEVFTTLDDNFVV